MLERIALHQTRLHTPGLGLDAKGIALGAKGIVLLPSIDRLVAMLSAYTRDRSLLDLVPSLRIDVVRSKLGAPEVVLEFAAESSDRMDRIADVARLVGGITFTGTSRHFVQYRDTAAPFGYDCAQLVTTDAALALYHDRFVQTYVTERTIDLAHLCLRLMLRSDPSTRLKPGPRFVVAESGLGAALAHYLVRSHVDGEACVAQWPPPSAFDDAPVRRWVIRVPEVPPRMLPLLHDTPGIASFIPAGPGVATEAGFRHPIELGACPLFDPSGLVLLRGRGEEPLSIARLPAMGTLASLSRIELRSEGHDVSIASATLEPDAMKVPLRVVPSSARYHRLKGTFIARTQLPLLRRIGYLLPHTVVAHLRIALVAEGAFLTALSGIEAIPLGTYFSEVHPRLYLLAGHRLAPAVSPETLASALGIPSSRVLFIGRGGRGIAIEESAFVTLESALLDAPPWERHVAEAITQALDEPSLELKTTAIGLVPLRGVEPPAEG